jgi:Flp pilus assembly protein TadD
VDATARLTEAAKLRPDSFEVRTNLGVVLARRGLFPQAEAEFT